MATPTFGMYVSWEKFISVTKIAAIMYDMYIINGVHGPEPRSSGGNTSFNPHVSPLIPRPAFNGMGRMCQCHGSNMAKLPSYSYESSPNDEHGSGVPGVNHYNNVTMGSMASQITSLTIVYSAVYSAQIKENIKSPASLAIVQGIHRDRWIPRTNGQ